MSEPTITEVQEQVIEMEGVKYHLENVSARGLERAKHQPWCVHCDGNAVAPREDMDRFKLFDHYCHGRRSPLLCDPDKGVVYKRVDESNAKADPAEMTTPNNTTDAVEALASSDLFAEICPTHSAIVKAMKWRNDHTQHVERLESTVTHCFPPCREDLNHPELWKAGSWKWLREFFPANTQGQTRGGSRPDQTEQCRRCGTLICHSCSDIDDYLCVECQNEERQEKFADGEYVGQEVEDEEYGRGTIEFENGENVTVRAHEDGKMFVLPKSALIANTEGQTRGGSRVV